MSAAVVWLSDDTCGAHVPTVERGQRRAPLRGPGTAGKQCEGSVGPNKRPRKERQPNWAGPEVMALIHAKQKEHDNQHLTGDSRDQMESAIAKWTKIASDVAQAGFSTHYRGPMACKNKWQVFFSDYKKIMDYRKGTGHNEDYFRMGSRRRKEVNLPPNFCP
jgi:hypothetical protein